MTNAPNRALKCRDQWWCTYNGHYMALSSEAEASTLATSGQDDTATFEAALAAKAAGDPVPVSPWVPELPIVGVDSVIAEDSSGDRHTVFERSDGRLATVNADHLELIRRRWIDSPLWTDDAVLRVEQMGEPWDAIRFTSDDTVFAYLMPTHASALPSWLRVAS